MTTRVERYCVSGFIIALSSYSLYADATPDAVYREGWEILAGARVAHGSSYLGSDEYETSIGPLLSISYTVGKYKLYSKVFDNGVNYQFNDRWNFDFGVGLQGGRSENDDDTLSGLGEIDDSYQISIATEYEAFKLLLLGGDISYSGADRDRSYSVSATTFIPTPVPRLGFRLNVGMTFGSEKHLMTQWGVSDDQSIASGYNPYEPKAGIQSYDISIESKYDFSPSCTALISASYVKFGEAVTDSPFVEQDYDVAASFGIAYIF